MRQGRLKAPAEHPRAYYHCTSRVVDRQMFFGQLEREHFIALMREYEEFCGVRIITHTILSNHFHLLVEVPRPPKDLPTDEELLVRIAKLSGWAGRADTRQQLQRLRQQGHHQAAEALRQSFLRRMWDISQFMKLLKQRFTQWFNRLKGRKGTLWEGRFGSVLVEGAGEVLAVMTAYIDLNCVRANLVEHPEDYRWCGYAEALAGHHQAQEGLRVAMAGALGMAVDSLDLQEALRQYRMWLYGQGAQDEGTDAQGRPLRPGISLQEVRAVLAAKGRISPVQCLRIRVRYFVDGAVLGSRGFVEGIFAALRSRFGPKRRSGARRLRGVDSTELYALRDLRLRLFG